MVRYPALRRLTSITVTLALVATTSGVSSLAVSASRNRLQSVVSSSRDRLQSSVSSSRDTVQSALSSGSNIAQAPLMRNRTLLMEQAQWMAVSASRDISKKANEITLQKMKYVEAVAAIKAKVKNLTTLRWSPLLSFKFPQKLDMTQEYDLNIKPITLQADISTLQHEWSDLRYAALLEANNAYLEAYVLQEKIRFTEERLERAKQELERNQLRLRSGDATQSDIDKMQKSIETLEQEYTTQKRNWESAKVELSEIIGLDVTTGYQFCDGLYTAAIPREQLDTIITYTLNNDHEYYAAKMGTSTALLNLNAYESMMRDQYGSKLDRIKPFVTAAKQGKDIDYAAYQLKYREMLTDIDKPWAGSIRILFFRFSKERLKGEISGTRYIEDEMYALYTACMDYANAKTEQESTEKNLRREITISFENIVSAENAYRAMQDNVAELKERYDRLQPLNRLGKVTYEEVNDTLEEYQAAQVEAMDLLADYNELLYAFDRLTCGAVTKYFKGESLVTDGGSVADSFPSETDASTDGAYYHLSTSVADMVFQFGIEIPDGYEPAVTHYELWCGDQQIGERTPATSEIRHLALDYQDTSTLTVRLYDGDTFVGECDIDARVPRDTLDFFSSTQTAATTRVPVGSYRLSVTPVGEMHLAELTLTLNASEGVFFYRLTYADGKPVGPKDPIPIEQSFRYLTVLTSSIADIRLVFYDKTRTEVYRASMSEEGRSIWRETDTDTSTAGSTPGSTAEPQ